MQQKYEVIRLIEQNAGCHIIMDYVEGEKLITYLKNYPDIEKEQLFLWLRQIIKQLDSIQRVRGMNGYGYVTPYCMIVKKDKSIAFLDFNAESNASVMRLIGKDIIQESFFSTEREDDYYSLGKTMQYIFAHVSVNPKLTKREEHKFLKIISKCLSEHFKKHYSNISDILKDFPRKKEKKNRYLWGFCFILALIIWNCFRFFPKTNTENETVTDYALLFDMGLTHFIDLGDYQKSMEFFEKSKPGGGFGADYAEIAKFMCETSEKSEDEVEKILEQIEEKIQEESVEDIRYVRSLLKVYMRLDTETARMKMIELSERLLNDESWKEDDYGNKIEIEIRELLAGVYSKNAEYKKAIEEYQVLCQWNHNEEYYKTIIELYEKGNQEKKALETCQKFLEKESYSKEISIIYIRMLCKNTTIERTILEKEIRKIVERFPKLSEEPEFQKLQNEYGIEMKGENIWVEK